MKADGSNKTRLTRTGKGEYWPAWSPDGDKIAFIKGYRGLRTMNADGSGDPYLVADWVVSPADWAPDGDRLVVEGGGPQGAGIYILDEMGKLAQPVILRDALWNNPVFSPNGTKILAQMCLDLEGHMQTGIYKMNIDGSKVTLIRKQRRQTCTQVDWQPV